MKRWRMVRRHPGSPSQATIHDEAYTTVEFDPRSRPWRLIWRTAYQERSTTCYNEACTRDHREGAEHGHADRQPPRRQGR